MSDVPGPRSLPERPPPPRLPLVRVREWVTWFGPGRLAAIAGSVAAIVLGGFWLVRAPQPAVEDGLPRATAAPAASSVPGGSSAPGTTAVPSTVVVHVTGAVASPGVFRLPPGARVDDAVAAAGGALPEADTAAVNLAAVLADGSRVYLPRTGETPPPVAAVTPAGGTPPTTTSAPVDINTAGVAQLELLPGVGPATAQAIVAHREASGPFASVDELGDVRGIGPAKLESIRPLVTV